VADGGLGHGFRPGKRGDCVGKNPTDRAKLGTKRHIQTDGQGIPLNALLSGANDHDKTQLAGVLDGRVVRRRSPRKTRQHLCLDKGYDYPDIRLMVRRRGYIPHIPRRGEASGQRKHPGGRARRWVVERTNRWHNLFRRLRIRYEVHAQNYLGFVELACAIICFRRARAP
jgi:transposase